MNSNQKGSQSNKQSDTSTGNKPGVQGGSHEQHVEAGRQSHKNDSGNKQSDNKQSDSKQSDHKQSDNKQAGGAGTKQSGAGNANSGNTGSKQSTAGGTRAGSPEQHAEAGRHSHKNDR